MKESISTQCKNCNEVVSGKFCSECGQDTSTERITYHTIIHEIEHGILHIDKGILYTVKELILRPGKNIKDFLAGKRVSHFKPFAFIFITATIYAALAKFSHGGALFDNIQIEVDDSNEDVFVDILRWVKNHYAYAMILMLPFTSLSTYLIFRKQGYNYFEHLVINAYTTGVKTFTNILIIPFYYFFTSSIAISRLDNIKSYLSILISVYFYYQVFSNGSIIRRILSSIASYILSYVFLILLILAAVLIFEL